MGWLRQKIGDIATNNNGRALQKFIDSVAGMNRDEVSFMLVAATVQRLGLDKHGYVRLTAYMDGEPIEDADLYPIKVGNVIKQLQKMPEDLPSAGAMMIWLHSARAIAAPSLRILGKKLWAELAKGQDETKLRVAAVASERARTIALPDDFSSDACLYVPKMLDPSL